MADQNEMLDAIRETLNKKWGKKRNPDGSKLSAEQFNASLPEGLKFNPETGDYEGGMFGKAVEKVYGSKPSDSKPDPVSALTNDPAVKDAITGLLNRSAKKTVYASPNPGMSMGQDKWDDFFKGSKAAGPSTTLSGQQAVEKVFGSRWNQGATAEDRMANNRSLLAGGAPRGGTSVDPVTGTVAQVASTSTPKDTFLASRLMGLGYGNTDKNSGQWDPYAVDPEEERLRKLASRPAKTGTIDI